jgi:hypothetical protein
MGAVERASLRRAGIGAASPPPAGDPSNSAAPCPFYPIGPSGLWPNFRKWPDYDSDEQKQRLPPAAGGAAPIAFCRETDEVPMMTRSLFVLLSVVLLWSATSAATVAGGHHGHQPCCQHCGTTCQAYQLVERTILVPITITETRMKSRVVSTIKDREETCTVFRRVPVTRKFEKEICYLDDEVRTKTITETECHRVDNPVVRTSVIKVPETVIRPEVVQKEICTEHGVVCVEEVCEKAITVLRDDFRTDTYCEPDVVFEKSTRQIDYCVKVPKKTTIPCAEETVYELVPVTKTRVVQVCVPEIVKEPYEVQVRKMVPKTILCCEPCTKKLLK